MWPRQKGLKEWRVEPVFLIKEVTHSLRLPSLSWDPWQSPSFCFGIQVAHGFYPVLVPNHNFVSIARIENNGIISLQGTTEDKCIAAWNGVRTIGCHKASLTDMTNREANGPVLEMFLSSAITCFHVSSYVLDQTWTIEILKSHVSLVQTHGISDLFCVPCFGSSEASWWRVLP